MIEARWRCGIVVPWMNRAIEDELPLLISGSDVALHWSRVLPARLPADRNDESYLPSLLEDLPTAMARLAPSDLKEVLLGCTSATISPVVTVGGRSVVTAFHCLSLALDSRPTLLCTPYSEATTTGIADALRRQEHAIEHVLSLKDDREFRDLPSTEIAAQIARYWRPGIEQVAISCTALYTADVPAILQSCYGIQARVITSITAMANFIRARRALSSSTNTSTIQDSSS